ncbi:MAG: ABC transporter permease [Armatimonadetes bacterium]|nr:ABC transporter permease [Armatimonadota bacterium]
MNDWVKRSLVTSLIWLVGAALGLVASISLLQIVILATSDGNTFGMGMMMVLFAPFAAVFGCVLGVVGAVHLRGTIDAEVDVEKRKSRKRVATLAAITPVALFLIACFLYEHFDDPPLDDQLIANFNEHRDTFEKLLQMTATDSRLLRVDENWTDPRDPGSIGVSSDRIETYRRLCREAHVPRGLSRYAGNVEFMYWGIGSAVSDDLDKGYAYLDTAPPNLKASLDGFEPKSRAAERHYRHIRGNWYLYIDYIPG